MAKPSPWENDSLHSMERTLLLDAVGTHGKAIPLGERLPERGRFFTPLRPDSRDSVPFRMTLFTENSPQGPCGPVKSVRVKSLRGHNALSLLKNYSLFIVHCSLYILCVTLNSELLTLNFGYSLFIVNCSLPSLSLNPEPLYP